MRTRVRDCGGVCSIRPNPACSAASLSPSASPRTVFLFTALFAVLIGNLTYIQIIKADEYQSMPSNNHTIMRQAYIQRGSIITSDGLTLAESVRQDDGTYVRSYPNGNMAAHNGGLLLHALRQLGRREHHERHAYRIEGLFELGECRALARRRRTAG